MPKLRGLYALDTDAYEMIYGPDERREIERHVEMVARPQTRQSLAARPELLRDVEVLFSGWGAPVADEAFLDCAPRLEAIFYASGAVGCWMSEAVWHRGVLVTSAYAANAIPVAEYTLSTILFSLKHGWQLARATREQRTFPRRDDAPGCYQSTVGLISLGAIGRAVLKLLRPFDLRVLAYDPLLTDAEAERLGVRNVPLDVLFRESDVISVHSPDLPETEGLISGAMLCSMRQGGTFINTARGQVVREPEMIDVLTRRPDLQAVLDVTCPEPPQPDSPLYTLPNVLLTPHIAGSVGNECRRMGRYMVEELERYVAGEPLLWTITPEIAAASSHRPATPRQNPAEVPAPVSVCRTVGRR
jgi:phosphoglycerate dehydrogenase-like enzyme